MNKSLLPLISPSNPLKAVLPVVYSKVAGPRYWTLSGTINPPLALKANANLLLLSSFSF